MAGPQRPIIHGYDHRRGGPDPIPGLGRCCPGFTHVGVPIHEAYYGPGSLEAWWRLGDAGPFPSSATNTANVALDSGPHARHMAGRNTDNIAGSGSVWIPAADARLPSMQVAGALVGGDVNDGGITFNYDYINPDTNALVLQAPTAMLTDEPIAGAVGVGLTISCFLQFHPFDGAVDNLWIATANAAWPLLSTFSHSFGGANRGMKIGFTGVDGQLELDTFDNATTGIHTVLLPFHFVAGEWFHYAHVFEKTGSSTYRRRLYVNLNLVSEETGSAATVVPSQGGTGLTLGGGWQNDVWWVTGRGSVDELAIWSTPLTYDELQAVYQGRVSTEGMGWTTDTINPIVDIEDNSITTRQIGSATATGDAPADQVVTSDGGGGTEFAYPTIAVEY
jgi:Concanavalin A-like lectin/glucanases superfamily